MEEVKAFLRLDADMTEDDMILYGFIEAAKSKLHTATGRQSYGSQTVVAKVVCCYWIGHWYEDRSVFAPTPQMVEKPMITSLVTQLKLGGGGDA